MKKIMSIKILFILILFISMGCGCEKDPIEPDYPMEITTADDLNGIWDFVSLYVPGTGAILTECDELVNEMVPWSGKVYRSYNFTSATLKADITDQCVPAVEYLNENYSANATHIIIGGAHFPFTYDHVTGKLTLEIPPPGGIAGHLEVTVQKQ